jgi:hypothetical protein
MPNAAAVSSEWIGRLEIPVWIRQDNCFLGIERHHQFLFWRGAQRRKTTSTRGNPIGRPTAALSAKWSRHRAMAEGLLRGSERNKAALAVTADRAGKVSRGKLSTQAHAHEVSESLAFSPGCLLRIGLIAPRPEAH